MKKLALLAAAALVLLAATIAACVSADASAQSGQAELSLERHVQSQGLFPAAGDYVRYDITVKNTGPSAIEGMSLWVNFVPVQGSDVGSSARFEVPLLAPGASAQLHLGPFKLHSAGEHALYLGINRAGDAKSPDDIALNIKPGVPVDSVTALEPAVVAVLPAGVGIAAAGTGLLAWLFFMREKSAHDAPT
jgi:hypothetical protein